MRFLARLKDGIAFDQAAAEMATISDALSKEHPGTNGGWRLRLAPVSELTGGAGFWVVIALFLLSIGLLLAIATANVSNLALSRSCRASGSWRFAARWAPGADGWCASSSPKDSCSRSRRRSCRCRWRWPASARFRRRPAEAVFRQLTIDVHELSFVALVTLICPLVFSIAPVRLLSRPEMRQVLAASGVRGATASTRGRGALVVLQVALAVILLTVSSLAVRAIRQIYTAPIGLDTANVMLLGLDFNEMSYPETAQVLRRGSADARSAGGAAGRDDGGDGERAADSRRSHAACRSCSTPRPATPTRSSRTRW